MKQCEWDEWTINAAAFKGNLEMLKYCFSNGCPCEEKEACTQAAAGGHLDCLRFLVDKVQPSRGTEMQAAGEAACGGHVEILKYFVEERKMIEEVGKFTLVSGAAKYGQIDCLKYLIEEAKVPPHAWHRRSRSVLRAPRLRKLLARKRLSRTNGRRLRKICQTSTIKVRATERRLMRA